MTSHVSTPDGTRVYGTVADFTTRSSVCTIMPFCQYVLAADSWNSLDGREARDRHELSRLRDAGLMHTQPHRVRDRLFVGPSDFFDSHDVLQVRCELLRAHLVEGDKIAGLWPPLRCQPEGPLIRMTTKITSMRIPDAVRRSFSWIIVLTPLSLRY
jgi:hypothetical protein